MKLEPMLGGWLGEFFGGLPMWWWPALIALIGLVVFYFWYRKRQV